MSGVVSSFVDSLINTIKIIIGMSEDLVSWLTKKPFANPPNDLFGAFQELFNTIVSALVGKNIADLTWLEIAIASIIPILTGVVILKFFSLIWNAIPVL